MNARPSKVRRRIGQNLRLIRKHRGWSQERLAEAAGLHFTYISMLERGVSNVTVDTLDKLTRVLRCEISEIFDDPQIVERKFPE